jgi:hypothetical protein
MFVLLVCSQFAVHAAPLCAAYTEPFKTEPACNERGLEVAAELRRKAPWAVHWTRCKKE